MAQDRGEGTNVDVKAGSDQAQPLVYVADGARMILPDHTNLLHASFARRDGDLLVGSADQPALVILDYFTSDSTPDLVTEGGAVLAGQVVAKLAGPDLAGSKEAAEALGQAPIGHVESAEGTVIITRADGSQVIATKGTPVFQDDVITTDGAGSVGLRFVDGMTLSLGSDARMVLDEFVYNPEANEGGGIIEIIQGAFSFISGEAAHMGLDSMVIETPTMTIGIRGTKVVANAAAEGETTEVVLLPEDDGTIGKIMISTEAGQELLEQPFVSTTVTSRFLPPASQTVVTPEWVYSHYSEPLAALPTPTVEHKAPNRELELPSSNTIERADSADERSLRPEAAEQDSPDIAGTTVARERPAETKTVVERATSEPVVAKTTESQAAKSSTLLDTDPFSDLPESTPDQPIQNNEAPVIAAPIADTGATEDTVFSYDVSSSFSDADVASGDALTFGAALSNGAALPTWLSINPTTGVLSGTPLNANVGTLALTVTATDSAGASAATSFQLTISNSNDTPVVVTPISDTSAAEDAAFSYDVSASFADDDSIHGDTFTYVATQSDGSPLPAWLSLDSATGILSGTPLNADVGALTIEVTAVDAAGAGAASGFQLTITNVNDAPVVVTPIADATPLENTLFTYDVAGHFADDDTLHGDALTFSAEQSGGAPLPAWLSIDPATGVLSGTPDASQAGTPYMIDVTATDGLGADVTSTFQLTVDNVNDAPVLNVLPSPTLTSVPANATDPAGDTIAEIVVDGSISDSDGGAVEAIAVTGVDDSNGTWEFSVNAGASWTAVGAVSDSAALLLDGDAKLRFVPDPGYGGSSTFSFRAWDQTTGSNGQAGVDVSTNGGTTAFSAQTDTGAVSVQGTTPDLTSGSEFQINTTTADRQENPSVAALSDGGFVVTWDSNNQDGDNEGVFGQRYDSTGSAVGSEFQINTTTADEQKEPSVAALDDGGFVVVWQSKNQDGDNWGIYSQRYDSAGLPVGSETQVNATTLQAQDNPSITALGDGGFVIAWQSNNQDGDKDGIYGQRFDSTGAVVGSEFQINSTTSDDQQMPSIAALGDGGFVVAWQSNNQDGDSWGIYGQRYDDSGVGRWFRISDQHHNDRSAKRAIGRRA